jgi:outer membrane murein-binding lipoprotein Lpp
MSDEIPQKPARQAAKKPAPPHATQKPKAAAATTGLSAAARVSVPVIPEASASDPAALSRRGSAARLALLTATLTLIVGGFAWFADAPSQLASSTMGVASGSAETVFPLADPLAAHVRQGLEQDHRMASLALDIRQSQESISRLWTDAQSLAASVGVLAKGVDELKSDLAEARIDAAAGIARLEERDHEERLAGLIEPIILGDPALQQPIRLGDPQIALTASRVASVDPAQPATTGGLPGTNAAPQASVEVNVNKAKSRVRAPKPITGWHVHAAGDDLALVAENEGALYEVRPGELLPGVGIVRAIKKRGDEWVVLTSKGVITEAR